MVSTHHPFSGVVSDVSEARSVADVLEMAPEFRTEISHGPVWYAPTVGCGSEAALVEESKDLTHLDRYSAVLGDGKPLGAIVGKGQGIRQPILSLEDGQFLVDNLGAKWAAVGTTHNGLKTLVEVDLPQEAFSIQRGDREDHFKPRIVLPDANDGSKSFDPTLLLHALLCSNEYPAIDAENRRLRQKHTSGIAKRQGDARLFLVQAVERIAKERGVLQSMEDTHMPQASFIEFAARLLTGKDKPEEALKVVAESEGRTEATLKRKFETLETLFRKGTGNRGRTALDAFSAVTEWRTWGGQADEDATLLARVQAQSLGRNLGTLVDDIATATQSNRDAMDVVLTADERRRTEQRLHSNLSGNSAKMVARAQSLLLEYVDAPTAA